MNYREKFEAQETKKFLNYLVSDEITPLLEDFGYKKKKDAWYKTNGDIFIQIEIIKTIRNNGRRIAFKFLIAMFLNEKNSKPVELKKTLNNFEWNPKENFVSEIDYFLTDEHLLYKKQNFGWMDWYIVSQETFEEIVDSHLLNDFENYLIPQLEKINNEKLFNKTLKEKKPKVLKLK